MMAKTAIWKYPVAGEDSFTIQMPVGSLPVSVGVQDGSPVLWAVVDPEYHRQELHRFYLRGTGHPLGEAVGARFIGTFQLVDLGLVFHLFDGGPEEQQT